MPNLGSISEQTLGGALTTATHGSGINYGVISTHVLALRLLLADGSVVRCSRTEETDLFKASLCGLGCTGLLISVALQVEPAFYLKEVSETIELDEAISKLDELANSGQHVRMWWFPQTDKVRVDTLNRTTEVSWGSFVIESVYPEVIGGNFRAFPHIVKAGDEQLVLGLCCRPPRPTIPPIPLSVVAGYRLLCRSPQGVAYWRQVRPSRRQPQSIQSGLQRMTQYPLSTNLYLIPLSTVPPIHYRMVHPIQQLSAVFTRVTVPD